MEACLSSGLKIASALIKSGRCEFLGVLIITDGTNPATVTVQDGLTATGTELFKGVVAGANNFDNFVAGLPIKAKVGIYVTVSGTGASYIAYYR